MSCLWGSILLMLAMTPIVGCSREPAKPAPRPQAKATPRGKTESVPTPAAAADRGAALYAQHCASCHGEQGDAKGIAATFLFPKPRDFRAGHFRLVSTANGVPTPADLEAVIVRGMPGSSMPPWAHVSKADRQLLAQHVVRLSRDGAKQRFVKMQDELGEDVKEDELQKFVRDKTTPGEEPKVPAIAAATSDSTARGKALYTQQGCHQCHGPQGKGDGEQAMVDAEGLPTRPRDLTRGLFKGQDDPASVYKRIALGLPGTPMPASQATLKPEQMVDLTHYVLSLSDPATRAATVLSRERLVAKHVQQLPRSADDAAWRAVPATALRMTPLWWRNDADPSLNVQAAHDGISIVFRMQWRDATANQQVSRAETFRDAAALELYRGAAEPFLGMGDAKNRVDVWMWDAARQGGLADTEVAYPRTVVDHYPFNEQAVATAEYDRAGAKTENQPDLAFPARAAGNPLATRRLGGSSLTVGGPGSVTFRPPVSQLVDASGQWSSGRWTVLMKRKLAVEKSDDGVKLEPGGTASVAFAIWEGSHGDRNGQKLVTIWQDLALESAR